MDESDADLVELARVHSITIEHYREQDWAAAIRMFEQVLTLRPNDPPALQMVDRCRQYQDVPTGDNWDGVFRMQTK